MQEMVRLFDLNLSAIGSRNKCGMLTSSLNSCKVVPVSFTLAFLLCASGYLVQQVLFWGYLAPVGGQDVVQFVPVGAFSALCTLSLTAAISNEGPL